MKIKKQTRKLAAGCSKHCFEVVDKTDEVSNHIYGKAKLTWFEFDFRRVSVRRKSHKHTLWLFYFHKNGKIVRVEMEFET